ncbi:hypothetical protein DRQ11_00220 [candidate division KSB1 bacterium]|nr:MAG: hypothetical protein DRQ11_00220 [candidate division KSB1 bacterium]
MKLKILCINCFESKDQIQHFSFYESPSFIDYDVLIIDPQSIAEAWTTNINVEKFSDGTIWSFSVNDAGFGNFLKQLMNRRSEETKLLLEKTGGIVLCFLRAIDEPLNLAYSNYEKESRTILHTYSWLPVKDFYYMSKPKGIRSNDIQNTLNEYHFSPQYFFLKNRVGKEIGKVTKSHPFSQYFAALKDAIYFEAVINDPKLIAVSKPIAMNKVGEIIALELPFNQGKFIFLPPFSDSVDISKVFGVLIDCVRKALQWTPPLSRPIWLKDYSLPEEEILKNKLREIEKEIQVMEQKKEGIQSQIDELELLKGLLYETGKYGLEPAVRKAFRIIGFNVLEPEDYERPYDLYIEEGDLLIIGEVEGTEKQVDVEKYRQLLDYVTEATVEGHNCKGILIGNGYNNIEPTKRQEQFTDQTIRGCESQGYCRMTTFELFKTIRFILANGQKPKLKKLLKETIINCSGEFNLDDLKLN